MFKDDFKTKADAQKKARTYSAKTTKHKIVKRGGRWWLYIINKDETWSGYGIR